MPYPSHGVLGTASLPQARVPQDALQFLARELV